MCEVSADNNDSGATSGHAAVSCCTTGSSSWRQHFAKYKKHFVVLLWRELLMSTRNPADVAGRMLTFVFVSLIAGIMEYDKEGGASSMWSRMQVGG